RRGDQRGAGRAPVHAALGMGRRRRRRGDRPADERRRPAPGVAGAENRRPDAHPLLRLRAARAPGARGRGAQAAALAQHHAGARLVLVGEPLTMRYAQELSALADALAPGAVIFERSLPADALADRYRSAHAFLCLSEHEGFCIPVLEALHFGVPVIARPAGAVPEVAGDAALLVADEDPAVVAELIHLAVSDAALRAELRRRGAARVAAYAPGRPEAAL